MSLKAWPLTLSLLIALIAAQIALGARLQRMRQEDLRLEREQESATFMRAKKWDPRLFEVLSFGHLPAAIDWMWMRMLQDSSLEHVKHGFHPQFYYDVDLATDLDPAFFDIYVAGANLLAVVRDDGLGAKLLLEKADRFRKERLQDYPESFREEYWPAEWDVPLLLAYVNLFELKSMPDAATAFTEAAALPGAPAYLHHLAERLGKPGGQYEVGLKLLNFMISTAKDERVRHQMEEQKRFLSLEGYLFKLNYQFDEYLKERNGGIELPPAVLWSRWEEFREEKQVPPKDPFGGDIRLGETGKVESTTPHQPVFGLN